MTILPSVLRAFRERYPDIDIEVGISPRHASLTKRDADVAIRAGNEAPESLVGKRIAQIEFGIYGCRSYLGRQADDNGPEGLDWIAVDDSLAHVSTNQWRLREFPDAPVRTRFDSLLGILGAAREGLGIAFLPHVLARPVPGLVCLESRPAVWTLGLWLLTHADLQHMYRIKQFLKCAEDTLSKVDLTR